LKAIAGNQLEWTAARENDLATVDQPRGNLKNRYLSFMSDDGDLLTIHMDAVPDFRKPFPLPSRRNLIGTGRIAATAAEGYSLVNEALAFRWLGESSSVLLMRGSSSKNLDVAQLERILRTFLGTQFAVFPDPMEIMTPKADVTQFTTRQFLQVKFIDQEASLPPGGPNGLQKIIELSLSYREGSWGIGVTGLLTEDDAQARVKMIDEIRSQFVDQYGQFFNSIHRFDILPVDRRHGRFDATVEGELSNGELVDWTFSISVLA
jgi:hypothetical protein